jgi:hypothetical protein
MKKAKLIALLLAGFSLLAVGCSLTGDDDSEKTGETETSTTEDEDSSGDVYDQNDIVEVDGKEISITEVRIYKEYGEYYEPEEGKKFLLVKLSIESVSDEAVYYSEFNYDLFNKDGEIQTTGYTDIEPALSGGTLGSAGRKASGYIVFEVDEDADTSDFELQYENWGETAVWQLD